MIDRALKVSKERSFFLFGARGTGKSTLLRQVFPKPEATLWIDLLDPEQESRFALHPESLSAVLDEELKQKTPKPWVVIDEIQKVPALLGIVHQYIRAKKFRFALTGSSARKLKRAQADMLAGRASLFELFPLNHLELQSGFSLEKALQWGTLPEAWELSPEECRRYLRSYCQVYLKEEVISEQLVRKVQPFRNFLELAAIQNGQIINYSKFARDCGVDENTIVTYFEILSDTLLGFEIPPFHLSVRKRQRKNPKFYLFDLGVTRTLANRLDETLVPRTSAYGFIFEHFVILEIYRLIRTRELDWKMTYLNTKDNKEIDLIVEKKAHSRVAIEIKSTDRVDEAEVHSFERLAKDIPNAKLLLLSQDRTPQKYGEVSCLHWKEGIEKIFSNEL